MWMDFSFIGLGASFSAEGGLSAADGPLEYKLLFSRDDSLNGQKAEGFVNVFKNAMSGEGASGLSEGELPVVLPLAGKLLPDSTDLAMEKMDVPADFAGFDALPCWRDGDAESMPEASFSGMFNPFTAEASPIQGIDRPVVLPGATLATNERQASRTPVENSMKLAGEPASLAQLDLGPEGQRPSLSRSSAALSAKDGLLSESRKGLFPSDPAPGSHDLPRMLGSRLGAAGPAPGWREGGMPGEDSSARISTTQPFVSRQEIIAGETGGNSGLFSATDRKEIHPQMAADPVPAKIRPGRSREDRPLSIHENRKGKGAGRYQPSVVTHGAEASPARPTAEAFPRPAIVLGPVGAAQAAVSRSRLSRTADANIQVLPRGRDKGATMTGNPFFQLQGPEKNLAEPVVRPGAISSNTDNQPDASLSALVSEDRDSGGPVMGARQAPAQAAAMPGSATAGVLPRHTEINIPLGHAAWEQSLARQLLQAGQGQLRQLHIKLNPSNLGSLDIKLQVDGDATNIAFSSQHAVVREAVEASLPRLREMLSGSGINLGNLDVGGQDTAGGQQGDARSGGLSPGNLFAGGEDEQGGVMDNGRQSRKGKEDNQLLDYYV